MQFARKVSTPALLASLAMGRLEIWSISAGEDGEAEASRPGQAADMLPKAPGWARESPCLVSQHCIPKIKMRRNFSSMDDFAEEVLAVLEDQCIPGQVH